MAYKCERMTKNEWDNYIETSEKLVKLIDELQAELNEERTAVQILTRLLSDETNARIKAEKKVENARKWIEGMKKKESVNDGRA